MWPRVCSCQGAVVCRLSQGCHESGQESLNGQWHLVAILWHIWHESLRLGSSAELVNCPVLFTPKVEKQRMNTPDLMVTLTKNPLETKKVAAGCGDTMMDVLLEPGWGTGRYAACHSRKSHSWLKTAKEAGWGISLLKAHP